MDQHKYKVVFEDFTKRHFIKNFEKKYKSQWNKTQEDIIFVCEHIENMLLTIVELGYQSCWYEGHICDDDNITGKMAEILNVP